MRFCAFFLPLFLLVSCASEPPSPLLWDWALPKHVSPPVIPANNPMTKAKVELGRHLFYDKRLSSDQSLSCATCHKQSFAFADGKKTPSSPTAEKFPRNSQGLSNVAYYRAYTWGNPVLHTLEQQALVPLFSDFPRELAIGSNTASVLQRFSSSSRYRRLFRDAFPEASSEALVSLDHILKALASFQRALISLNAPFDRYLAGQKDALSPSAKRGWQLFQSDTLQCNNCHGGVLLTQAVKMQRGSTQEEDFFANTGLYNLGGKGLYPAPNVGLHEFTNVDSDMGKFRIPSLRNVEVTGPYMHDGSIATLEEVLDHYARGGRRINEGPFQGDGSKNPHKDPRISGFSLSLEEKTDLVAFLKSLTDRSFLVDKRFSSPFATTQ